MTGPEHCILGAVLAHLGFHQKWGARVTAVMVIASILPDADTLTLVAGRAAYYEYHRTLFHSLGGIAVASAVTAVLVLLTAKAAGRLARRAGPSSRLGRWAGYVGERGNANPLRSVLLVFGVSMLVMVAHLGLDTLFPWPIPLLWPFSHRAVGYPVLDWGDEVTLAILLAGMFGLGLMRNRTRLAAVLTCLALAGYLAFRSAYPAVPLVGE
jgi:membrane-bound metal-dependent hydrolase YbcI (DUF457 family)